MWWILVGSDRLGPGCLVLRVDTREKSGGKNRVMTSIAPLTRVSSSGMVKLFFFFCLIFWGLVFWLAILYLHLGCTNTIVIVYMTSMVCICGLCLWVCVYGYVFMDCLCVYGYVYGYEFTALCMDIRS
jgi:hypothetical protein